MLAPVEYAQEAPVLIVNSWVLGTNSGVGKRWLADDATLHNTGSEPGHTHLRSLLQTLRGQGFKLRDVTSFGLQGHVRVSMHPPVAQDALARVWRAACDEMSSYRG